MQVDSTNFYALQRTDATRYYIFPGNTIACFGGVYNARGDRENITGEHLPASGKYICLFNTA